MVELLEATIAVFGICHLLVYQDGPAKILFKIRNKIKPFRCMPCSVVWVAIPLSIWTGIGLLGYLFVIGGVILLDRFEL